MFIKVDVVHVSVLKPSVTHLHAPVKGEIFVTDISSRLSQLTWDSGFCLLMPVSDVEPVAMYLYKCRWLYTQNIWFFTCLFSLTCKICHIAQWLRKLAKIQLLPFAPHRFVTGATGDLCYGNVAFRL